MSTSDYVKSCLALVATVCSPKEVVMAVEQQLSGLLNDGEDDSADGCDDDDARDPAFRLACLTTMYTSGASLVASHIGSHTFADEPQLRAQP